MDFLLQWIVPPEAKVGATAYVAVAFASVMISAVSKGGFGGGIGVISVPLLMQIVPTPFAIGILLPVLVVCDVATIHRFPAQWEPRVLGHLSPGMILGIGGTTYFLMTLGKSDSGMKMLELFLQISVAVIAVTFVFLQLRSASSDERPAWRPGWSAHIPVGLLCGVTTTIAHAAGPIVNMYLLPQKLDRGAFVGTCGRLFVIFNTLKIPFMVHAGFISWTTVRYGLWMMLLAPLGVGLGAWLNRRLSPLWFTRIVYASLILAAGKLLLDAFYSGPK
jgi:uncharacterized membrane protein YfcA